MGRAGKTASVARWSAAASLILLAMSIAAQAQGQRDQVDRSQSGPVEPSQQVAPPPPAGAPVTNIPSNVGSGCGAVAYTADGAFGAAFGMTTCEEAERLAVDACRRESTEKADCSRGVVKSTNSWFAITFCRNGREWTTNVSSDSTQAGAQQAAANWASKSKYGSGRCRVVPNGVLHSGGLHTKR